ncbi:MAG: IclR family transcriptional regulator, partial [Dehalococcoidales bacterium]|nr:IclR family transcriptional regulator [Dehalococcoidales bacterium]
YNRLMSNRKRISVTRKYTTPAAKSATVVTSLRRATEILICLSNDVHTVTDIASYCRLSVSTVHRQLQTLRKLGWVIQDESSHKYYLGPLVNRLSSNHIVVHRYLIAHALPEMLRLAELSEETVHLGIAQYLHYRLLHEIPSKHDLRITEETRKLAPLPIYAGATAKVLLSQLDDEELQMTLRHIKINRITENTVTDKNQFLAQIEEVRRVGYSVSRGERIPGGLCIAAPIRGYVCPASLSIVGPEERLRDNVDKIVPELKTSVERISREIAEVFTRREVMDKERKNLSEGA